MLYIALAEAVTLAAVASAFTGLVRSLIRQQARERDLLLNQMLHLAGKPWQPAPADTVPDDAPDFVPRRWTPSPEQDPLVS